MKKLITLALLLVAASAFAQTDPGTDGLGVYFDLGGTSNCMTATINPYTPVTGYLLATRLTESSGVSGWECKMMFDVAPAIPPTYAIQGGGLNVLTAPDFQVGIPSALPFAPAINLLSFTLYYTAPIRFAIGPCSVSSFNPAAPGYAKGSDPGVLKRFTLAASDAVAGTPGYYFVAGINANCPVADATSSWTGVKNLYQ
jgi:hypothetical protein